MKYILVILTGYLLGCSSMAWYLAKLYKADLRGSGTGNLGASNTVVLLGWKAGVLTALHDILKAFLAVLIAGWLFPDLEHGRAAAGVACVLGHIFPFYLTFKGGKGFASFFGMTLALNWRLALVIAVKELLRAPLDTLFAGHMAARAVRYFLIVITAGIIWPMTFGWFSRLGRKVKIK